MMMICLGDMTSDQYFKLGALAMLLMHLSMENTLVNFPIHKFFCKNSFFFYIFICNTNWKSCSLGTGHGTKVEGLFQFSKPMDLKPGTNHISILGVTVGLPVMIFTIGIKINRYFIFSINFLNND